MSASVKRSQRIRRDVVDDAASDDALSPSRPAKRARRDTVRSHATKKSRSDEDSARISNGDQLVTQVSQHLKNQQVQAAKDHANSIHEANSDGVKAYAKLSAADWTFYITKLSTNIGRSSEVLPNRTEDEDEGDDDYIHIDLGPGKLVSRHHASISFDSKTEEWVLHVQGRNGAKVDTQALKQGSDHYLNSGEVIEIGAVEMMFVLPTEITPLNIHQIFLDRCHTKADQSPGRTYNGQRSTSVTHKSPGTPPPTRDRTGDLEITTPIAATTPGVMSGSRNIDLSQDDNHHIKPQYSYAQMITQAISAAPGGKLNLNGIYTYITNTYSYYRHQQAGAWQNSIRHNLSLNRAFEKVARMSDEPGKGMKWQLTPDASDEMIRNAWKVGRGGHRGSSAPSSPNQLNYITHGPKDMASRISPLSKKQTAHYNTSPVSRATLRGLQSTPDGTTNRLPRPASSAIRDGSPVPRTRKKTAGESSFSSFQPQSPALTSSYLQDETGNSLTTPAPLRVNPRLAPPSTAQRPSQHMPTSSPAPFWKYVDISSTPMRPTEPYEASPSKLVQNSSPPGKNKSPPSSPLRSHKSLNLETGAKMDPEEEEPFFDLAKGFESIGAYHSTARRGLPASKTLEGRT